MTSVSTYFALAGDFFTGVFFEDTAGWFLPPPRLDEGLGLYASPDLSGEESTSSFTFLFLTALPFPFFTGGSSSSESSESVLGVALQNNISCYAGLFVNILGSKNICKILLEVLSKLRS